MSVTDKYYVLQTEIDGRKFYMTMSYGLTDDIRRAAKCANKLTASFLKEDYYIKFKISGKYDAKRDFKTILVNVTYEWEE